MLAGSTFFHLISAAGVLLIVLVLRAILTMNKAPEWFGLAWFASGVGATRLFGYLCWSGWTNPASRNWHMIPLIFALPIFAIFVFWIPFLGSFSRSTRLLNRLEDAIKAGSPDAEALLAEARQLIGTGAKLEQMYLDSYEGKLRHRRGLPAEAVEPLRRAMTAALRKQDRLLGGEVVVVLVKVLLVMSQPEEAAEWANDAERAWGQIDGLRDALGGAGNAA